MTGRPFTAQDARSSAPFVTIRAGGTLEGVVTISAIAAASDTVLVHATWTRLGEQQSVSATIDGRQAQVLANKWSNQLTLDREPFP